MDEEKKNQEVEAPKEKTVMEKAKEVVETKIEKLLETGIQAGNADYLYKLVDIHKDIENEEYWKIKKEVLSYDVR